LKASQSSFFSRRERSFPLRTPRTGPPQGGQGPSRPPGVPVTAFAFPFCPPLRYWSSIDLGSSQSPLDHLRTRPRLNLPGNLPFPPGLGIHGKHSRCSPCPEENSPPRSENILIHGQFSLDPCPSWSFPKNIPPPLRGGQNCYGISSVASSCLTGSGGTPRSFDLLWELTLAARFL